MFRIFAHFCCCPLQPAHRVFYSPMTFPTGMADGWLELDTGAEYEVVDECYCISAGENVDYGSSFNADQPEGMSIANYSVYVRFKAENPTHAALVFVRFDYTAETGYFLYLRVYQDMVRIGRQNGAGWVVLTETDYDFNYDQTYWTRFMVVDDGLWGKVWQGELADEPMDWLISAQDTTCTDPGHFGLERRTCPVRQVSMWSSTM